MEAETVSKLVEELLSRISPAIPIESTFWNKKQLCAYLSMSPTSINRIILSPDFPPVYRFPATHKEGIKGNPRWSSSEVKEWAKKYRGRKASL